MRIWAALALAVLVGACSSTDDDDGLTPPVDTGVVGEDAGVDKDAEADGGPVDTGTTNDATVDDATVDAGLAYYTWWQDVQPIVANKCQLCHAEPPQFGAPRAFVTYEDTQALIGTAPVHEVMVFRIFADMDRMPPSTQPQLTDQEKEIIQTWSLIGAPEGTPPNNPDAGVSTDAGMPGDAGPPTRPVSRTFEIRAVNQGTSDPYDLPVDDTNYLCWSFTVPQGMATDEHAFRFEPLIDNTANNHHMLLFHDENGGNDPGPFGCSGFPLDWDMIAGWAPGRMADEIPAGAGVPIQAGDQLVLQVHYDNVTQSGVTDNSGIRVLMTDQPNLIPAGILWAGVVWGSAINGSNVSRGNTCTLQQNVTMFTVFPHMHQVGKRITMEVQRSGQSNWTSLVDVSGWNFEDQPNIPIPPSEQSFSSGDRLRTTCWWDTGGQNVSWGEASNDEMCFNFVYHYPKINFGQACIGFAP